MMNTKGFINIVFVGLLCFQANPQSYFNILDSSCLTYGQVIEHNNEFLLGGAVYNPSGTGSRVLSRYSLVGISILIDTFSTDGVVTTNGKFVVFGNKIAFLNNITDSPQPLTSANFNADSTDLQFSFLDFDFNILETFRLGGNKNENAVTLLHNEGAFYLLSSSRSFNTRTAFYCIKIDDQGNVLWEKTYGGTIYDDYPNSITTTNDGNYIISGQRQVGGSEWDIYMVKINPDGEVLWEKQYGMGVQDVGGRLGQLHDHTYIMKRNLSNGQVGSIGFANIDKLDPNGNIIWTKSFPKGERSSLTYIDPFENGDGSIIVHGYYLNNLGNPVGWVMKLDPLGNVMWEKEYYTRDDLPQYIYDVKPTEDGGYVMCGSAFPPDLQIQQAWLLKTDCNGAEGVQHPLGEPCIVYDCTQFPIDASFTASSTLIDLADGGQVTFENNSGNTTSRVWSLDDTIVYMSENLSHTFTQEGVYEVQLIVFHGTCSDTSTVEVVVTNTAGLTPLLSDKLVNLYPNPNQGSFEVSNLTGSPINMDISDALGKVIYTQSIEKPTEKIDLHLKSGVYLVAFKQKEVVLIKKIVIN
jgi:hypothetical protein